jgi:2-keto-4-pentenoate hydratase/2-oxohepta-3-ene-1,7-dioic acid hydratase in catechol pathway
MHDLILKATHTTISVGKMLCLGKNYEKHAREMGSDVPADPVIFLKPATALIRSGGMVLIPSISHELHHEVELVVVIDRTARDVSEEEAMNYVLGYAVGLDMTLRDLQSAAKKRGEPWAVAKGFDTSAPISEVVLKESVADPHALTLNLEVNGELRQHGSTADMILSIPRIISYLSRIFTLERGDCIFTGTPEGVGQVVAGDRLKATIEGVAELVVGVGERTGER